MKSGGFLFFGIIALLVVLSTYSVAAVGPNAPTNLHAEQNVTPVYDEGTFSINWTSGAGDPEKNYSVYISINGGTSFFNKTINTSTTGFSYTNTTQANYTFKIGAVNNTGTEANSTTLVSIFIDKTVPVVNLPAYTNATLKKNTDQLTLNISVADADSGTTGTLCLVDANGTNQTIAYSSGWCNGTVGLTGLSDGNKTIKVYANDTVNNFGLNNSYAVSIDTTVPTASASCSPLNVVVGSTFPCSCSGSDGGSGVVTTSSSSTSGSTSDTFSTGAFTYTCSVTDIVSSGQGIPIPQPPKTTHLWPKITPGDSTIMKDFDPAIGIKQIEVTVNNDAQNVIITVTKYDGKPADVSVAKTGKINQYIRIETQNLLDKLNSADVQFRVNKSWAASNGVDKNRIVVSKFDETNSKWNELPTTYSNEDASYYYYDTKLSSFSYFAISEKSLTGGTSSGTPYAGTAKTGKNMTWLWVLVILVVVVAAWLGMRKKNKF